MRQSWRQATTVPPLPATHWSATPPAPCLTSLPTLVGVTVVVSYCLEHVCAGCSMAGRCSAFARLCRPSGWGSFRPSLDVAHLSSLLLRLCCAEFLAAVERKGELLRSGLRAALAGNPHVKVRQAQSTAVCWVNANAACLHAAPFAACLAIAAEWPCPPCLPQEGARPGLSCPILCVTNA